HNRGYDEAVYTSASSVLDLVAVPAVGHHLLFRPGDRRPRCPARRTRRQPGRYRRDPQTIRPRPAARGAILAVYDEPAPGRSRQVVLLSDAGYEPISRPV